MVVSRIAPLALRCGLVSFLMLAVQAQAQSLKFWVPPDGSNNAWETPENWSPKGKPGQNDYAVLNNALTDVLNVTINEAVDVSGLWVLNSNAGSGFVISGPSPTLKVKSFALGSV